MADEIQVAHTRTGRTLYALVRNSVGDVWRTTSGTFVGYLTANLADYAVALTEQGTASRFYTGDLPATSPAGIYSTTAFEQLGGAPAEGDPGAGGGDINWDGTAVVPLSSRTKPADTQVANAVQIAGNATAATNLAGMYGALETGTAQAGGASTVTLRAGATAGANKLKDQAIFLETGPGAPETNRIMSYDPITKIATVETPWVTPPDNTTTYAVVGRIG